MRFFAIGVLILSGCGGAAPAPAAPLEQAPSAPAAAQKPAPAPEPAPEPKPEAPSEPKPTAEAAPETPTATETGPTRRPTEILVAPKLAFVVDYASSGPHEAAERSCDAEAGDDAAARAECMKKARATFRADVLEFKKDAQGKFWLTVYERKGSALPELYKVRVEFADETANGVTVRLKEEKGTRPFFAGVRQIAVSVRNDYALELNDPKLGKLPYGAKVGLVGDN